MKKFLLGASLPCTLLFMWSVASAQTSSSSSSAASSSMSSLSSSSSLPSSSSSSSSLFTGCPDSISQYTQVKNGCIGGHILSYYDDHQCLTYKCILNSESSSSSSSHPTDCASYNISNASIRLTCSRSGGTISETRNANGCLILQCLKKTETPDNTLRCVKNGCILTCSDGANYNTCPNNACTVSSSSSSTCTRTPSGRCTWVRCGSSVKRVCP